MINDAEWRSINAFEEAHSKTCTKPPTISCAIEVSNFEIIIRRNSVANTVAVRCCVCGAEHNATDYDCW